MGSMQGTDITMNNNNNSLVDTSISSDASKKRNGDALEDGEDSQGKKQKLTDAPDASPTSATSETGEQVPASAEQVLAKEQKKLRSQRKRIKALETRCRDLERERDYLREERYEFEGIEEEVAELEGDNDDLAAEKQQLEHELDALRESHAALEEKQDKHDEELSTVKTANTHAESRLAVAELKLDTVEEALISALDDKSQLNAEKAALEKKLEEADKARDKAQKRVVTYVAHTQSNNALLMPREQSRGRPGGPG